MQLVPEAKLPEPLELAAWLYKRGATPLALLESGEGPEEKARYSIVAWGFREHVVVRDGGKAEVRTPHGVEERRVDDPLEPLEGRVKGRGPATYDGGYITYISYDAVQYWEELPRIPGDPEGWPLLEAFKPRYYVVYDHVHGKAYTNVEDPSSLGSDEALEDYEARMVSVTLPREAFEEAVERILEHIRSGEAFQVVLSKAYRYQFKGSPLAVYARLREASKAPFMYFVSTGSAVVAGCSPELLVKVSRGIVETHPIAGTRPRGATPEEDLALEKDLVSDVKERAEHVMLVDLARNDLGKVCCPGTVVVEEFMEVEKYSNVQHLVSVVKGKLHPSATSLDAIRATFPAGTVTGAPKPRAMEIIYDLEPEARGPYAGAVGFICENGGLELAITIRSFFARNGYLRIQAGAGVVYDSKPSREWMETEYKLRDLRRVIECQT